MGLLKKRKKFSKEKRAQLKKEGYTEKEIRKMEEKRRKLFFWWFWWGAGILALLGVSIAGSLSNPGSLGGSGSGPGNSDGTGPGDGDGNGNGGADDGSGNGSDDGSGNGSGDGSGDGPSGNHPDSGTGSGDGDSNGPGAGNGTGDQDGGADEGVAADDDWKVVDENGNEIGFETEEDAHDWLADREYDIAGVDASGPVPITGPFAPGNTIKDSTGTYTWQTGYDYDIRLSNVNWYGHTWVQDDRFNFTIMPFYGEYVYSEGEKDIYVPERLEMSATVLDLSGVTPENALGLVLDTLNLPHDENYVLSGLVNGDGNLNGSWAMSNDSLQETDGTRYLHLLEDGAQPTSCFVDDREECFRELTVHSSDYVIENSYTRKADTADLLESWEYGYSFGTEVADYGIMPGTTYRHLRLSPAPNQYEFDYKPAYTFTSEEGFYPDLGGGTYERTEYNWMDPLRLRGFLDQVPYSGNFWQHDTVNYHSTDEWWTGTNVEGWYTDDYIPEGHPDMGDMSWFWREFDEIYEWTSGSDDFTTDIATVGGTKGSWRITDKLTGDPIDGAPEPFNTKALAIKWLVDNGHLDVSDVEAII